MTRKNREHDRYVAKVNNLVAAGRDDIIEELVSDYEHNELSGREAFWQPAGTGWPVGRRHGR